MRIRVFMMNGTVLYCLGGKSEQPLYMSQKKKKVSDKY